MKLTLALALVFSFLAFAQPTITLSGAPARPGAISTITVTLSGSAASAPAAVQWFISPVVPGMTVVAGAATTAAGKSVTCKVLGTEFRCTAAGDAVSGGKTVLADGVIATISVPQPALMTGLTLSAMLGANVPADKPGIPVTAGAPFSLVPVSTCDLNGDGRIDTLDARNVIDQIEGVIPAVTDLDGDGKTTIVDLQRVVNASIDGLCRIG